MLGMVSKGLVALVMGASMLGGCATVEQVERAQASADAAKIQADQAFAAAQAAQQRADAANAAALQAQAAARDAAAAADVARSTSERIETTRLARGERG